MSETTRPGFVHAIDVASAGNGGRVLSASDDFFAEKENLLNPAEPVFKPGLFTDRGKWMDGWESRRRRDPGNDWCTVQLGYRSVLEGVDIYTRHFNGNEPESALIEATDLGRGQSLETAEWTPITENTPLGPDRHNYTPVNSDRPWTHVRLQIYPDGGVARLRVYGRAVFDWDSLGEGQIVELSGIKYGGRPVSCSNEHFGTMQNLIKISDGANMGDGWETARRRDGLHDWVIIELGHKGNVHSVTVDTRHFKGNAPGSCSIDGFVADSGDISNPDWISVIKRTNIEPDMVVSLDGVQVQGPFSHIRLNIFPDGGVSRLRVFGTSAP